MSPLADWASGRSCRLSLRASAPRARPRGPAAICMISVDAFVSTKFSSDVAFRCEVVSIEAATAGEFVLGRSRLYVEEVEVGTGGCGVVGTPKAALVPESRRRFGLAESISL